MSHVAVNEQPQQPCRRQLQVHRPAYEHAGNNQSSHQQRRSEQERQLARHAFLIQRQHELADEMDDLRAWEEELTQRGPRIERAIQRLCALRGKAIAGVLFARGRTTLSEQYQYERRRLVQEHDRAQQEWSHCREQQVAVQRKLHRVLFELSLL